ncbi:MAG: lipopolysaccharide assembly protein LapB, partial [Candidatus Regiella insecticola]|nr:lipopolysaccharide assembly protein LapB [Candidatus Regiella insecticola]
NGEWIKAVDSLQRVLQQDKDIVSEVLPLLQGCYQHLQQIDNWTKFLHRCVKKNTGTAAELMMAELIEQKEGRNVAQAYINKQLQQYPTMRLF